MANLIDKSDPGREEPDPEREEQKGLLPGDRSQREQLSSKCSQPLFCQALATQVVSSIIQSFGWANAGLFDNAVIKSVESVDRFDEINSVNESPLLKILLYWGYILILVVLIIMLTYSMGFFFHGKQQGKKTVMHPKDHKYLVFVEKEFSLVTKTIYTLMVTTLGISCAMAISNGATFSYGIAMGVKFQSGKFVDVDGYSLFFVQLVYAVLVTITIVVISFYIIGRNKKKNNSADEETSIKKDEANKKKDKQGDSKKIMKKTKKKTLARKVCTQIGGVVLAVGWRGVFRILIENISGESRENHVVGSWIYSILVFVVATLLLSAGDIAGFLIYKTARVFKNKIEEFQFVGAQLDSALKFNVGLALASACSSTFALLSIEHELLGSWLYCFGMLFIMVVTSLWIKQLLLKLDKKIGGWLEFIDDHVDVLDFEEWDRTHERNSYCTYFRVNAPNVFITAIEIASGLSVLPAVNVTLSYSTKAKEDVVSIAWVWIAFLLALLLTSLVTVYLGRVLTKTAEVISEITDDIIELMGLDSDSEDRETMSRNKKEISVPNKSE